MKRCLQLHFQVIYLLRLQAFWYKSIFFLKPWPQIFFNPFDKDVSELPNKAENEPDSESVAQFEMYQKLKTAFLSAKIKDKPDNTLTSYCQG